MPVLLYDLTHPEALNNTPGPTSRCKGTITKLKLLPSIQKSNGGKEKNSQPTNPSG